MNESVVCCPLSYDSSSSGPEFHERTIRTARKEHVCFECRDTIAKGSKYEHVVGKWDGYVSTHKTCTLCVEIRNHFACGNGWIYGEVWHDLAENFFPDMKAGGPCMQGLSPEAKARLFERRLQWLEDSA